MPRPTNTTCPNCGAPTVLIVPVSPDTAPYLCAPCARAWWPAELTRQARASWQHETRDFGDRSQAVFDAANSDRGST